MHGRPTHPLHPPPPPQADGVIGPLCGKNWAIKAVWKNAAGQSAPINVPDPVTMAPCCAAHGSACADTAQCCDLAGGDTCVSGKCCRAAGAQCGEASECCDATHVCEGGVCKAPPT